VRGYNPFNKWRMGYRPLDAAPSNEGGGNLTPANHKVTGADQLRKGSVRISQGEMVNLPRNLYAPPSSQSLDISNQTSIPALTLVPIPILTYIAEPGAMTQLLSYAITTDGPGFTFFIPSVNGFRVYPQHGRPSLGFSITFATGPSLGNDSLINAQLPLKPGDRLDWFVQNIDVVPHNVGVRSSGHIMSNQALEDTRFGG